MRKYVLYCTVLMLLAGVCVRAQDSYNDRAEKYIEQYAELAMKEQVRAGIPASITLGQGIYETEAGASELATKANNHFGIKCKRDWKGGTFSHTDDAPDECFRMYKCAEDSYTDHSDYLKQNKRYHPLFSIKPTDYKSWAVCLKRCGYATNPQYAQNLIKIIEKFKLQDYTYTALDSALLANYMAPDEDTADEETPVANISEIQSIADSARDFIVNKQAAPPPVAAPPPPDIDSSKEVTVNGMRAFYARKGEMLLPYALKYKIRYPHLLEINDLPDGPLPFNTYVYLERKKTLGTHARHIVKEGENLLMISQMEGVQLKKLMSMNRLEPDEEPVTGTSLYLQSASAIKPAIKTNETIAHAGNAIMATEDTTTAEEEDGFIATNQLKTPAQHEPAAAPLAGGTVAEAATTPVVANTAKDEPRTDTATRQEPPSHVIVVKEDTHPPVPEQPATAHVITPDKEPTPLKEPDTMTEEDFTKLKAELDKVVYADDKKLSGSTQDQVAEPARVMEYYVVKRGDTAFSIAHRNNITVSQLLEWNDMVASDIKVGQSLRVK